jgi:hypothetical protein
MMGQAESALQKALNCSSGENISSYFVHEEVVEQGCAIKDEVMRMAFQSFLMVAYCQVPGHLLQAAADKLHPFLDSVANRSDTGRTGTDTF